jgi:hypothetical protein
MKDNNNRIELKYGVYVGRFCPVHIKHERVIGKMLEKYGNKNSLVIVGSCNSHQNFRNIFNYSDRKYFLKSIFPELRVVGMPDYGNVPRWLEALDDILRLAGINPKEVEYFGGSAEDVSYFIDDGRKVAILNRHKGEYPDLSATFIRNCLRDRKYQEAGKYLNRKACTDIKNRFRERYRDLKISEEAR